MKAIAGQRAPLQVAVIGAGWAGCAAAVALTEAGHAVTLLEASRTLGGRARRVALDDISLDNGQHILLGAYTACLGLMRKVGVDPATALLRLPVQMRYPPGSADSEGGIDNSNGIDFIAPRLPAPFHMAVALWRATGMPRSDKWALARFFSAMRWIDWRLSEDCAVSTLLARYDQSPLLQRQLWHPLCVAALNTPPERASARVFLAVLRDSLGARRSASDMLLPRINLSALLPDAAAAYVTRGGGKVETGVAVKRIELVGGERPGRRLYAGGTQALPELFDRVVIATSPQQAAALLADCDAGSAENSSRSGNAENPAYAAMPASAAHGAAGSGDAAGTAIAAFSYEPISTCYLQYSPTLRLRQPFFALHENAAVGAWGQYVFDRGQLATSVDASQAGLLAVVVSSAGNAIALGADALAAGIARQLAQAFDREVLAQPVWHKVITEKRATFSCAPDLKRPSQVTDAHGVFLAGDYTESDYPATLESAVRSGIAAARLAGKQAEIKSAAFG